MKKRGPVPSIAIVLASVILATVFFVACAQSNQTASAPAAAPQAAPAERVFVVFEGPWAFAPDPKEAGKVLAIAPKTKTHRDLYVAASNHATLASGIYDLSVPVTGGAGAATADPNIAQAKTTAADLQHALDDKSNRYVIRLPKPEAYVAATRFRSRVASTYPPDASTEKDFITAVSLRYSVSSVNGFSLSGSSDSGSFSPLLLQVETPTVSFVIDPAQEDDPCHTHSRESFRDLTKLLKVTLFVDFPDSPNSCHDKDPQKSKMAQSGQPPLLERFAALLDENGANVQMASLSPETASIDPRFVGPRLGATRHLMAATFLFFGHIPTDCTAPVLMLTTTS